MASAPTTSADKYQDFSGLSATARSSDNPYDALIEASHNSPVEIQARYETHRRSRNAQQEVKLLSPDFAAVDIDQILYKLLHREEYPDFADPRHCLVFWARPTQAVKRLVRDVQEKLLEVLPSLWLMPQDNLHMTAMEITHSLTEPEIAERVEKLRPSLQEITDYTFGHRARLMRPMIGFDASAFALGFVPGTGREGDAYTYHHLRRDLHALCKDSGVEVASRYVVPSAHLTIARFVTQKDTSTGGDANKPADPEKMKAVVEKIKEVNRWLEEEYWPSAEGEQIKEGGEWMVGQEKGLDCSYGTLWYGYTNQRARLGKGY